MRLLPCLCLCAGLWAQDPQVPDDLQQLANAVDAVHRPDGASRQFHGFTADLEITQLAQNGPRGTATLKVQFLDHQPKNRKRPLPLIHYRVTDAAQPTERGRDLDGYWQLLDGKPQDLDTKDSQTELQAARRDLNLARQLLRFLDPGAVLRSLQDPQPIVEAVLKLGHTDPIPCRVATGTLPSFPRLYEIGEDTPVQIRCWVEQATNQLVALELWPLDKDHKPDLEHGELLRIDDLRLKDGVKLPYRIVHYQVTVDGKRNSQSQARIVDIQLDPAITAEDFGRYLQAGKTDRPR